MGIIVIIILSNIVFDIKVIHHDKNIRKLVMDELKKYDVNKYTFKKKYNEIEKIEDDILKNNKDRLEWIEIVTYGTRYIVRVEERKINDSNRLNNYQNIISKKNAVIVKIDAISGEKVKSVNDYVKKGEVVISGNVTLPNNTVVRKMAKGVVYGEVWYRVDMDYPFVY